MLADLTPELSGDDHLVAAAPQSIAYILFTAAFAVDVRRVEEGDTRVECRVDHLFAGFGIDPPAEVVAPQSNYRNFQKPYASLLHAPFSIMGCRIPAPRFTVRPRRITVTATGSG